jgi:hypothetical protein
MKFFKITLPRGPGGFQYPPQYQVEIGDKAQDHLYYTENDTTYLLLAIKDVDAVGIIRTNVVEILAVDAGTISLAHDDAPIKITDEGMIRHCEMKVARKLQLTGVSMNE